MLISDKLAQQAFDALRQWAAAERDGDEDELANARIARDEVLEDLGDAVEQCDGPRCQKCHDPVTPLNGLLVDYLDSRWLCDSCAAAQEHEWDQAREDRG